MKNSNFKIKNHLLFLILLFSVFYFLFSGRCEAAVLYLQSSQAQYSPGDNFIAEIRIDPEKECINTVKADLFFEKEALEVKDFSQGNSILSIWLREPEFSNENGTISFTGGIPGGYCGILSGDPGESNLLGRIIFEVRDKKAETTKVSFLDSSEVLLNDGLGTPVKLTFKEKIFTISSEVDKINGREWQEELAKDEIPPESFEINISRDNSIFGGKYFITFLTNDKQTGIDYYEIKEGKKDWEKATSPYLLKDQRLKSTIKVKAVDKAGNERIAEYVPPEEPKSIPSWIIIGIILIFIIVGTFLLIRKKYLLCKKP